MVREKAAPIFYERADSPNLTQNIWLGNGSLKSPQPPFSKGGRRGDFWDHLEPQAKLFQKDDLILVAAAPLFGTAMVNLPGHDVRAFHILSFMIIIKFTYHVIPAGERRFLPCFPRPRF
jgi:hypothetical protein